MKNKKETFSVAVIATMSSGKSTTLNAMLGLPLLPSMNEACTATVYKIEDVDGLDHFKARYITREGKASDWQSINCGDDTLKEWNDSGFESIEIQGDFPHIDNHKKIISFIDTPGPNNSSDKSHSEITHSIIANSKFGFVLCVMNASHFGVDDERSLLTNLLDDLNKKGQKSKIVFAVNKIDQLDIEGGESPKTLIKNIRKYLNQVGYFRPTVVPIMSLASLEIREIIEAHKKNKALPFSIRKQKKILRDINGLFQFSGDYRDASINTKIQNKHLEAAQKQERNVDKCDFVTLAGSEISIEKLIKADIITGIPLLEEMLEIELLKNSNRSYKPKKIAIKKKVKLKIRQKKQIKKKIRKNQKNNLRNKK